MMNMQQDFASMWLLCHIIFSCVERFCILLERQHTVLSMQLSMEPLRQVGEKPPDSLSSIN